MIKFIKKLFNKWWLFGFIVGSAVVFSVVFGLVYHVYSEYWKPLHVFQIFAGDKEKASELHLLFARNFGWSIWVGISILGLLGTLGLTIWGRKTQEKQWKTQHDSHLHERYEKAANMLEKKTTAVRVAGCRALRILAIDDEDMKEQCLSLLFTFIRHPYLENPEKKLYNNAKNNDGKLFNKDKFFEKIFPNIEFLRDDIQEAADSFSVIYDEYGDEKIDIGQIILPLYFLRNLRKNPTSLIKANLMNISCGEVYLKNANLQKVNLNLVKLQRVNLQNANLKKASLKSAELQKANLRNAQMQKIILEHANLQGANLSNANLQEANLEYVKMNDANLRDANLQGANLRDAKLQGANLECAKLQMADLWDANLTDACITDADMREVKNLTKEQVLSAVWGNDELGLSEPPMLPKELANDPEVKKWLAEPHYDLGEIEYD